MRCLSKVFLLKTWYLRSAPSSSTSPWFCSCFSLFFITFKQTKMDQCATVELWSWSHSCSFSLNVTYLLSPYYDTKDTKRDHIKTQRQTEWSKTLTMEEKKVIQLSLISGFHFFFSNRIGLITCAPIYWSTLRSWKYKIRSWITSLGNTLQKTFPKMSIPEASTPSLLWRSLRSSKSFSRYSVSSIFPTIFFITPRMYIPCLPSRECIS